MADETTRVDQWMHSLLTADATLTGLVGTRVYAELAPPEATYPLVVFSMLSAVDVRGANEAARIMVDGLWLVKAVDETRSFTGTLRSVADRIDALLHRSSGGTAAGTTIFTSVREYPIRMTEDLNGRIYRHLGAVFRLWAQ